MLERLLRRDMAAEHDPFERLAAPDEAMKLLDPTGAGERADPGFRHADFGVVRHHAQIAGERQLAAAAQREAVDRRDDRYGQGLDAIEELGNPPQIVVAQRKAARADARIRLREIAQMRARAEGAALTGDDQGARPARHARLERGAELVEQLEAQRVHLPFANHRGERDIELRPGERDRLAGAGLDS